MRILAVDIGTGTQDILLFDSSGPVENSPKLVMPSPTSVAARRIRAATAARRAVVLRGVIAGGGPSSWALGDHLKAGLPAFATPDAARTIDDDLDRVQADGVRLVSDEEATQIEGEQVVLRDLDLDAIRAALQAFDVDADFDGIAVGVFDHGAAPPDVSDRVFRFEHIADVLGHDADAHAFACLPGSLPTSLTRARAVLDAVDLNIPAVFMDNGPAAALGALHDPEVAREQRRAVLNVGNMHVLCFVLDGTRVEGVFEHHSGEVTPEQLAGLVADLLAGRLTNEAVYSSMGHGALYARGFEGGIAPVTMLAVTGPQRERMLPALRAAGLPHVHAAAPHGDMMISGCFGLLDGFAYRVPAAREAVAGLHSST
ncbi:MAG: DUF1786 domain-containing protein [Dehalococcoidia bacterium]|nr:DUF1786 domain-containing protein [Dehalococcoidia bacterium]